MNIIFFISFFIIGLNSRGLQFENIQQ